MNNCFNCGYKFSEKDIDRAFEEYINNLDWESNESTVFRLDGYQFNSITKYAYNKRLEIYFRDPSN